MPNERRERSVYDVRGAERTQEIISDPELHGGSRVFASGLQQLTRAARHHELARAWLHVVIAARARDEKRRGQEIGRVLVKGSRAARRESDSPTGWGGGRKNPDSINTNRQSVEKNRKFL
ncbi:hypothetical protein MRX96_027555 [Rhipicephalus microplus]